MKSAVINTKLQKTLKFFLKKFGSKEKVLIFAARFDGNGSSLKILKDKYKQVPRIN